MAAAWATDRRESARQRPSESSSDQAASAGTCFGYSLGVSRRPDYPRREVYTNSPLQLVAAEVRYPYAPRLRRQETLDALQIDLEDVLPIRRTVKQMSVEVNPAGEVNQQNEDIFRLFNRSFTTSAAITPTALTVETTSYTEFSDFRSLVQTVLEAVETSRGPTVVERIGLRYIDEVRVPNAISTSDDWRGWIADDLTSPVAIAPGQISTFQGAIETVTGADQKLVLRYAALNGTGVVGSDPLKRRDNPETGPFFVIDVDSFWEPSSAEHFIDYDSKQLVQRFVELHEPTGTAFQRTLTDRLRSLFRGEEVK